MEQTTQSQPQNQQVESTPKTGSSLTFQIEYLYYFLSLILVITSIVFTLSVNSSRLITFLLNFVPALNSFIIARKFTNDPKWALKQILLTLPVFVAYDILTAFMIFNAGLADALKHTENKLWLTILIFQIIFITMVFSYFKLKKGINRARENHANSSLISGQSQSAPTADSRFPAINTQAPVLSTTTTTTTTIPSTSTSRETEEFQSNLVSQLKFQFIFQKIIIGLLTLVAWGDYNKLDFTKILFRVPGNRRKYKSGLGRHWIDIYIWDWRPRWHINKYFYIFFLFKS